MLNLSRLIGLIWVLTSMQGVAATQVLKIATIAPDSTTWMQEIRGGAAEIEKATDGRVKFKFYPGGVMGNDRAVLRKLRIGQLQGGAVTTGALAEIFPDAQIYSLPFEFRSVEEIAYVRQRMDQKIAAGLEKKGLVLLGMANGGFAYFAGKNPVKGVEDLKKQRVWLPLGDVVGEAVFNAADVSPIPLSLADVYTALQTGLLDTVIANPASIIAFQWHTKINYLTDSPVLFLMGTLVVDKRAFDRINKEDKKIIQDKMQNVFSRLDALNRQDNLVAREVLANNGVEFLQVGDEEELAWNQYAEIALDALLKRGSYTEQFLNEMRGHIKMFRNVADEDG